MVDHGRSAAIKAGLARSKAAGGPSPGNRVQGPACEAATRVIYEMHIRALLDSGLSQVDIAQVLNAIGVRPVRGGRWSQQVVSRTIRRARAAA